MLFFGPTSGHQAAKGNTLRVFNRMKSSGRETLSPQELHSFLKAQGVPTATREAILQKLDADRDGKITREEFTEGFSAFVAGQLKEAVHEGHDH